MPRYGFRRLVARVLAWAYTTARIDTLGFHWYAAGRFNRMSDITCELRRPAKVVVWGWASLVLLFLVTAPFVDMPWTVCVVTGTLYSLFLVVFTTGLALLGTPNRQRAMMVMLAAIFAGWGSLLLLLLFRPSVAIFGSILLVIEVILGLVMLGLVALSIAGWVRFCRQPQNASQPQTPPADNPGG